jgi:hypothetical protein
LDPVTWKVYADFLQTMRSREGYWHALPRDVARYWRARSDVTTDVFPMGSVLGKVQLTSNGVLVT